MTLWEELTEKSPGTGRRREQGEKRDGRSQPFCLPEGVDVRPHLLAGNVQGKGRFALDQLFRLLEGGFIAAGEALSLSGELGSLLVEAAAKSYQGSGISEITQTPLAP